MERDDVIAWEGEEGPVTILEVDAIRSFANAMLYTLQGTTDPGEQAIAKFLFGAARDEPEALAKVITGGRKIRRSAGDIPVVATLGKGGA